MPTIEVEVGILIGWRKPLVTGQLPPPSPTVTLDAVYVVSDDSEESDAYA